MGLPIISDIIDAVGDVAKELIPDKDKKRELEAGLERLKIEKEGEVQRQIHEELMAQMDINKEEAKHSSVFVSGWRPFIGWIGGIGLAYSFILEPLASWIARIAGYAGEFPALDTSSLMVLVTGMLGFGGLRTYEKVRDVASNTLPLVVKELPIGKRIELMPEEAPWPNKR